MTHMTEANLIDFTDDQIKEFLGYSWEAIKALEEAKKKDPVLEEMRTKVAEYSDTNYNNDIRTHRAKLKAARCQAQARGIKWRPPEGVE